MPLLSIAITISLPALPSRSFLIIWLPRPVPRPALPATGRRHRGSVVEGPAVRPAFLDPGAAGEGGAGSGGALQRLLAQVPQPHPEVGGHLHVCVFACMRVGWWMAACLMRGHVQGFHCVVASHCFARSVTPVCTAQPLGLSLLPRACHSPSEAGGRRWRRHSGRWWTPAATWRRIGSVGRRASGGGSALPARRCSRGRARTRPARRRRQQGSSAASGGAAGERALWACLQRCPFPRCAQQ